jgi:hypothetical protein
MYHIYRIYNSWTAIPCSLICHTNTVEEHSASVFIVMCCSDPEDREHVPPKCWFSPIRLHSVIIQKNML